MRTRDRDELSEDVARELAALDAALAGEPVEQDLAALRELALALRAARPVPGPELARRLDAKVEHGFPPRARRRRAWMGRRPAPLALGAAASIFIAVTAVVSSGVLSTGGGSSEPPSVSPAVRERSGQPQTGAARGPASTAAPATAPAPPSTGADRIPVQRKREVERSAALVLSAPSGKIEDVADGVIGVTDRYGGFVMSSSVSSGEDEAAGATLDLRIPSNRLQPALTDLSKLAHVRSRTQGSEDITAQFGSPRRHLADAIAERRALLRRLASAATPNETASIRARLRLAERRIDRARKTLRRLDARVGLAAVSVTVEPGREDHSGTWTIGDAARDSLSVLGAVLGALIIALAVTVPLALVLLVAWGARRSYLRHARERTLDTASRG
jgi:hypothetical protein